MPLSEFPRISLGYLPTPLIELKRLGKWLNGPKIFMKRDDLTGLGLGGNKIRKLEFLFGEALKQNCDTVITGGAIQSNHCRQTAAAAASVGLKCHLALGGMKPEMANGNLLLDYLFGANIHYCEGKRKGEELPEIAAKLKADGHKPFVIPYGGSNAVGALGFVAAVGEIKEQLAAKGISIDYIIFPSSSGGTHAGITVGADLYALNAKVIGMGIDQKDATEIPYESELACLGNELSERLKRSSDYKAIDFQVRKEYYGKGYGVMGDLEREAIATMARYEGILLDPVYSGRAMGGLIDMIRNKEFSPEENVLFWHTGGTPALFDYARELL
jgi:D-cysteine desulfhydrase family pyridoxal phosphate-dependent enzyme